MPLRACARSRLRARLAHTRLVRVCVHVCERTSAASPPTVPCAQTSRHKDGVNTSTTASVQRGRMYVQALLHELGKGSIETWTSELADMTDLELRTALGALLRQFGEKVQRGERWTNLPTDAMGGSVRDMAQEAPKVIAMALTRLLNNAWRTTMGRNAGRLVPVGYFQTYSFFKDAERLLKQRGAEQSVALGNEAKQRREQELFDHEQLLLFESLLSCSVAEHQRERGEHSRHPTDNLNLLLIVALQFALGKRCMNVRAHVSIRRPSPPLPSSTRFSLVRCSWTTSNGGTWR